MPFSWNFTVTEWPVYSDSQMDRNENSPDLAQSTKPQRGNRGHGLKDPDAAIKASSDPISVDSTEEAILKAIDLW